MEAKGKQQNRKDQCRLGWGCSLPSIDNVWKEVYEVERETKQRHQIVLHFEGNCSHMFKVMLVRFLKWLTIGYKRNRFFQGWCPEARRMVPQQTYCIMGFLTIQPLTKPGCLKPLTIRSVPFIPRRLGKHQNPHRTCAQTDLKRFML